MLQAITHIFPSKSWRHKTSKRKESDKCDLCKVLWITKGRYTTDGTLPTQDLGHIQQHVKPFSTCTRWPTTADGALFIGSSLD